MPDAFVTANGNDLSIVFTRLGELTRRGPRNKRLVSRCNFSVPIDIAPGTFLAGWSQSLQYGIIKPAGVRAGLGLDTKFTGPLGAMKFDMPAFEIEFPRNQNLNIPLAVANASRETFPENDRRYNRWKNRWCDKNRGKALEFAGTASTWSERDADNTPVVIAIDGLDVHADFGAVVQDCPTRPTP